MGEGRALLAWLHEALVAERRAVSEALAARHAALLNDVAEQLNAAGNCGHSSDANSRPETQVTLHTGSNSVSVVHRSHSLSQDNVHVSPTGKLESREDVVQSQVIPLTGLVANRNDDTGNGSRATSKDTPGSHRSDCIDNGCRDPLENTQSSHGDASPLQQRAPTPRSAGKSKTKFSQRLTGASASFVSDDQERAGRLILNLLNSPVFEFTLAMLIVINTVVMAVEAQYHGLDVAFKLSLPGSLPAAEAWSGAKDVFYALETFFGVVFTVELVLKFIALRLRFFKELWNLLDFAIVVGWLISFTKSGPFPVDPMLLRMARLARLLRLVRLMRQIQLFDSLYLMTTAITGSASVLMWSITLLVVAQMMIALILQSQLQDYILDESIPEATRLEIFMFYGSFSRNILTMFEITLGNWMVPCRVLVENVSEWYMLFFLAHKLVIGFSVVAVMTAVFISETFKVANVDDRIMVMNRERARKTHMKKFEELFLHADEDGDGRIDVDEFEKVLDDPDIKTWMDAMELEVHDHLELFQLLDKDGDEAISALELVDGVRRLKGAAKNYDVMTLHRNQQDIKTTLRGLTEAVKQNAQRGHQTASL